LKVPRTVSQSSRVELRVNLEDKAMLARAAAAENLDLSGFILSAALPKARSVLEVAEKFALSERGSRKLLALLENPPPPNERLIRAAKAGNRLG
jgi:uncharacterized protein (DUF1778 family)